MKLMLLMSLLILSMQASGLSIRDLTEEDLKAIKRGEMLIREKQKEGESWPELLAYSIMETSPLESVAIFAAYDHQQDYVPKMLKSKILKQPSPTEVIVQYELRLPWPIPNSKYTHRISLSKPKQNHYRIHWLSIQSNDADEMEGEAHFIKTEMGTLWLYRGFVKPKSFLAGLFEKNMVKDVTYSLEAIRKHTHFLKKKNKALMDKYVGHIVKSLDGKFSYGLSN